MEDLAAIQPPRTPEFAPAPIDATPERGLVELTSLLVDLNEPVEPQPLLSAERQNQLVQVRLGIAGSLFTALRWKHEPTAEHCLRVALLSSAWAMRLGLSVKERDEIELAALLHDIGKMGVPDQILLKPRPLSPQEMAVMEGHWLMGREILRSCCASTEVQEIVAHARAWFDGSKQQFVVAGERLPLGARILAITDAFDAMSTDHVYRRAMSRERALNELFRQAGRQFDPKLVRSFSEQHEFDRLKLYETVGQRWMKVLDPAAANSPWALNESPSPIEQISPEALFQQRLLDNMHDAVVFIDSNLRVIGWNHGAERLTGITRSSIHHRHWFPNLLHMRDEQSEPIADTDCPIAYAIRTGAQWRRRLHIRGRSGDVIAVDAHAVPVTSIDGASGGLTLVLHDVSPEITLEERCQNLHELATRDPLTKLANRAEFDRVHEVFVDEHLRSNVPCSLLIADIDHFKSVNDTYGHQVGDQVIQSFARLLKASCRAGDLVARYGGEEFVMLCAGCDGATAVRRGEELRQAFAETRQPGMGSKSATCSFGVTEIQPGDTPDTMLRRADRALLMAKDEGRNKVIQLGSGHELEGESKSTWLLRKPRKASSPDLLLEQDLISEVPLAVSIEKLRGFIADHHARIESIEGSLLVLAIAAAPPGLPSRRQTDKSVYYLMHIDVAEERTTTASRDGVSTIDTVVTRLHVAIAPQKSRDRRRKPQIERARQLLISFRAYLMANDVPTTADAGVLRRAKQLFVPWLAKK